MKIGFDAKRAFNNYTGLGNYSRFIIESLVQFVPENEYLLYTPKFPKNNPLSIDASQIRSTRFLWKGLWRSLLINKDLQQEKVNIFHGLSNEIPIGLQKSKIKSIVTIHDLIFLRYPDLYPKIDRFFYEKKFRYACDNADAIIAVSKQTKQDIIDFYHIPEERIRVIYQDCQDIYRNLLPSEQILTIKAKYNLSKPYLICVSSFSERKNQERLIKAFELLNRKDIELILIGGKSGYADKILSENPKNVRAIYGVPNADLPALYQGAILSVYPSFFEGFGIPIIESLHSSTPVVAAKGSCLEEAGGMGALYANPLDITDLADKISLLLNNQPLRDSLVEQGKIHIQQFSGQNIAKQVNQLYQDI